MKSRYITEDTKGEYFLMIPLKAKSWDKAVEKGDQVVNDLLSCISTTEDSKVHEDSPKFLKAIRKISKNLWKILK